MTETTTPAVPGVANERHPDLPEPLRRKFMMLVGATLSAPLAACGGGGGTAQAKSTPDTSTPDTPTPEISQGTSTPDSSTTDSSTTTPPSESDQQAPAPNGALVAFTLRRTSAGSNVPFALGHVFRKGDVPSGKALALDTSAFQVTPISLWDDGSVKHALIAGKVDLQAGVDKAVGVYVDTAATGAPLTEADLINASPIASITYGSYGTVTLASLLSTSAHVMTENAGPQYAAFQYIAPFPNDASLRAVFHVQLWAGTQYRVRVAVENGSAVSTSSSKSGNATVSIAGAQRLSASVSMLPGTRWDVVAASFAETSVRHDPVYLRASRLVPNYGYTSPSSATLDALERAYTPMAGLGWEPYMGATGYTPGIGLLPHWDALYCCSGDPRAYESSIAHSRAYGAYSIYFRDSATKQTPRFSDYATVYADSDTLSGGGAYVWEHAHHPNAGYLPWLLTAERFHLETLQANAWACYVTNYNKPLEAGGLAAYQNENRVVNSQTRSRAWRFRTYAAVAAVSPTGDLFAADCRSNVAANVARWKSLHVDTNTPATGLVGIYDDKDASTAGFQHSIFESLFLVAALGWAWDIEPGLDTAQKAQHQAVRDFAYRVPVGLTGRGRAYNEYAWQYAPGPYRMVIGSSSGTDTLYPNWGAVYQATYPDAPEEGTTIKAAYADDPSSYAFPQGNWGHLLTALSYAKDHGALGAASSYARMVGASNWNSNAVKYNDRPQYGVVSRI